MSQRKAFFTVIPLIFTSLLTEIFIINNSQRSASAMNKDTISITLQQSVSAVREDWLLGQIKARATVSRSPDEKELTLDNGLVRRKLRLSPNAATISLDNHSTGASLLRGVKPEAILEINGERFPIGGLAGQPNHAYLLSEWVDSMTPLPNAFRFTGLTTGKTQARFPWKRTGSMPNSSWPPSGVSVTLNFAPPEGKLPGVTVSVHYELYDGLPLIAKWVSIRNTGSTPIRLNRFVSETLAMVEPESIVENAERWEYPNVSVVTDYSFGGMAQTNSNRTANWITDLEYQTQVNYERKTPCLLEVRPPIGPDTDIAPGETLDTFRTFLLVHDSTDRERRGLAVRRMYRAIAPWCLDNPLMLHLTSTNPETVHTAIDQAAEAGFEMVIFSFGSGLNMEDTSPENITRFKEFADYAHQKGLRLGGYSLLASRRINDEQDVINPATGKTGGAIFGNSPCLCSQWGRDYFAHIQTFLEKTGFDLLEHDGSYPGDVCASTKHPDHHGLEDSQWKQFQRIANLYRWCRERGIYLNVPDWYFLSGSNKTGMGYRETNWSLPRAQQHIHARQNLYDGTWDKTPSMGWMFVPLVEYQGGGAAATIEPLKEHLPDYEQHLANCLGYGVQACYRGPRLFDSEETKALVKKWVSFYKENRAILESDVIHLRRADGRDVDGVLHVNPALPTRGLAVFYNPTNAPIEREWNLPLYYTGLSDKAEVQDAKGKRRTYTLDREYHIRLKIQIPANGATWYRITPSKK